MLGRCDDGDGPGELADSDDEEEPPPRPVHDLVNDEDDVDPMECVICNNGLHDSSLESHGGTPTSGGVQEDVTYLMMAIPAETPILHPTHLSASSI